MDLLLNSLDNRTQRHLAWILLWRSCCWRLLAPVRPSLHVAAGLCLSHCLMLMHSHNMCLLSTFCLEGIESCVRLQGFLTVAVRDMVQSMHLS